MWVFREGGLRLILRLQGEWRKLLIAEVGAGGGSLGRGDFLFL